MWLSSEVDVEPYREGVEGFDISIEGHGDGIPPASKVLDGDVLQRGASDQDPWAREFGGFDYFDSGLVVDSVHHSLHFEAIDVLPECYAFGHVFGAGYGGDVKACAADWH